MFQPSKEDREKYGMTEANRIFEMMALAMVFLALVAFFLKILIF